MSEALPTEFSIRIYGLFIENGSILLADEFHFDMEMTKFPGGGLEFGEGTLDCLKRELREEMQAEIRINSHFYTTDFYHKASFNGKQLMCIYYLAEFTEPVSTLMNKLPFENLIRVNGSFSFRWKAIEDLQPSDLTFRSDKHVAEMLVHWWKNANHKTKYR